MSFLEAKVRFAVLVLAVVVSVAVVVGVGVVGVVGVVVVFVSLLDCTFFSEVPFGRDCGSQLSDKAFNEPLLSSLISKIPFNNPVLGGRRCRGCRSCCCCFSLSRATVLEALVIRPVT